MSLFTAETNSKVILVFNFIPSKFWSLPQEVSKVVLLTGLNIHRETSGGSRFVTNNLLLCYKRSKTRSSSYTSLFFLITITTPCPLPIQNDMHSWWIEIKEIPKCKLYGNAKMKKEWNKSWMKLTVGILLVYNQDEVFW